MCGINGFNFKDQNLIQKMNQATAHRGPDDVGFYVDENVSLGHRRLSIIDLSESGHQPMWDKDKNLAIVFNGEIYNFKEIRKNLEPGCNFVSRTDTEVILYAYREYGSDCLNLFNGIFAFAIWDKQKKELFLARDRIGVKPLYYWQDGRRFIFSSEIKAVLEHNIPREIDFEALNLYLRMLYAPEPRTMFKGIKKLPPAHCAILRAGNLEIKKYWEVNDFEDFKDRREAQNKIKNLVKDSVRMQLVSDRPVGLYLSGGIDSTAVLGVVREVAPEITKTYSVGFDVDVEPEKYNVDFELARKTAKYYGTDHHELLISGKDVLENIEDIIWHMDEPVANATQSSMFLLSKEAKKEVAVVLSGDGADELFAGYERYYLSRLISRYQKIPKMLRKCPETILKFLNKQKLVSKLQSKPGAERFLAFNGQKDEVLGQVLQPEVWQKDAAKDFFDNKYFSIFANSQYPHSFANSHYNSHGRIRSAQVPSEARDEFACNDFEKHYLNTDRQSWLVDEYLLMVDKMTMAAGIEQRVPILDYRLAELAVKIPTKWKLENRQRGKKIWIEAIREYLPDFIQQAPKRGYVSPTAKWLRTDLRDFAYGTIKNLDSSIFNPAGVQKILDDHINSRRYNMQIIWALITWQVWCRNFIQNNV